MTIQELRNEIASIDERQLALEAERAELAFTAVIEKNTDAVKRLANVNAEITEIVTVTLPTLNAALREAQRREAVATVAAADEDIRERAKKARPIAERLAERGKKMDLAIAEYREQFSGIDQDLNELARLGIPTASRAIVAANLRRSHDAATSGLDKLGRPVPPNQRHTFDGLLRGWATPSINWIAEKLGKTTTAPKAA